MQILLSRSADVSIREQLARQMEMRILAGEIAEGQRLPSVRALARRLGVHHNTVSAAYGRLQASGHAVLRRGAGVFVHGSGGHRVDDALRRALGGLRAEGWSTAEVRGALQRWLSARPHRRLVVVDPAPEMAHLLALELRDALGVAAVPMSCEDAEGEEAALDDALVVVLPYHVERVRDLLPGTPVEPITIAVAEADRQALLDLPAGSIVALVSCSPALLRHAATLLQAWRGDELCVEACPLSERGRWKRLVPVADLVVADAATAPIVAPHGVRRLREFRLLSSAAIDQVRAALESA